MLVLMERQVETELKLGKKFRELCEEVLTVVKEREDVVEELERSNHVAKETARLLRRAQKHDLDKMMRFNCVFFAWFDSPLCDRVVDVIPGLLRARNRLKEDLEEQCMLLREKEKLVQALVVAWMYVNPLADVYDGNENGFLIV
uniref:Zinc finger, GRF-type n=1 Tax=Tanacetum cinerariifolium TaxID=118510 RepID=A0A6L2N421_TANCI|nr:zinc finger, GRF-type [Tanacetum cinerariifolium]